MGQRKLGRCCDVSGSLWNTGTQEHTLEGRPPDLGVKKLETVTKRQQRPAELERDGEGAG